MKKIKINARFELTKEEYDEFKALLRCECKTPSTVEDEVYLSAHEGFERRRRELRGKFDYALKGGKR